MHKGELRETGTHQELLALELEPTEEGKVSLRLTIPAMNLVRRPMGSAAPTIDGNEVTLGPFVFTYDEATHTLNGTVPSGFVPVYEIPFTLHRVEAVEAPVNILALPGTPPVPALAELGVARVSVGGLFAWAAYGAVVTAAEELFGPGTHIDLQALFVVGCRDRGHRNSA